MEQDGGCLQSTPEYAYLAMSNIDRAMTDGQGDIDVSDNFCGIVYRIPVLDDYDIHRIDPVIIETLHVICSIRM